MKTKGITALTRKIGEGISKNSPTILTGLGVAGLVTTTIMAVSATPKALLILEEERKNRELDRGHGVDEQFVPIEISNMDALKLTWKCYIPSAIMGAVTTTCIICANSINLRRNAALTSAYSLVDTALKEYQAKVVETIGKNKEQKIKDEIAQDKVSNTNQEAIVITGSGDTLCMDLTTGRYFRSTVEKIKRAEIDANVELIDSMWMSLNEVYGILDLPPVDIGWDIGWDVNRDGKIKINIRATIADNNEPCITMEFEKEPGPKYY